MASLYEKIIIHFEKSKSIPEKYLSNNVEFCDLSVKWIKISIISFPFSVSDTLSNSSKYIIGFIHLVSCKNSTNLPGFAPT